MTFDKSFLTYITSRLVARRQKEKNRKERVVVLLILISLGSALVGYILAGDGKDFLTDIPFRVLGALLGAAMGFIASVILALSFGYLLPYEETFVEYDKAEILAIRNISGLEGSFTFLSGSVGSDPSYVFFQRLPDGGAQLRKLPADVVVVFEESREDAYIAKVGRKRNLTSRPIFKVLFLPGFLFPENETEFDHYALHVPEGTIRGGIDFDLENLQ